MTINLKKGFTLIEFVVIMSIFGIVASIALFNFSGFSSNISLTNLTHDVALVIRDAQVRGISNRSTSDPETPIRRGVYFEYDTITSDYSNQIVVFDDDNSNAEYDSPDELIDTITIQSSDRIDDIETNNPNTCGDDNEEHLHILFQRPDPNPVIYCGNNIADFASIVISSADGSRQKFIDVQITGQISVR